MKRKAKLLLLIFCLHLMTIGGSIYLLQSNPTVYNTLASAGIGLNVLDSLGIWESELTDGRYITFVDENGQELDHTHHQVYVGDELILEDNNRYKVTSVDMNSLRATCQLVGREELAYLEEWDLMPALDVAAAKKNRIAIYSTHTSESYVPTDGTDSKPGKGGIKKVGQTLANVLEKNGVEAKVSNNNHEPHDANAYHRSRKTAAQLLKTNPAALIDVHRDGVPDPDFYKTTIDGKPATKIRLVVGRQNPHMSANLDFAKQIKAYFDKNYPGLIKGIFMGKGNYNQDLSPRAMLIEVGTHTNSRESAERGVEKFAEGLPKMLGIAGVGPGGTPGSGAPAGRGTSTSLIWLVVAVIVGGGAFLLISTGSLKGSLGKISNLGKEFANYLGPRSKKEEEPDKDDNSSDKG
ncbi:MAG: stage II sporulation protein P [Peptococcia bacterium]